VISALSFLARHIWGYIELVTTHSMPSVLSVLKNFVIYLSVPLGVYWWLTEGPGALFDSFRRWFHNRRRNKMINESGPRD